MSDRLHTSTFRGRIVPSTEDYRTPVTDVLGLHEVWYPTSERDIARAVAETSGRHTIVRSGVQVLADDVISRADVLINLRDVNDIHLIQQGSAVHVQGGATVEALAAFLISHDALLPLPDTPLRSIVSALISPSRSCLSDLLGPLEDHVCGLHTTDADGLEAVFRPLPHRSCLDQVRGSNSVVKAIDFKLVKPRARAPLELRQYTFPYPGWERLETFLGDVARVAWGAVRFTIDAYHSTREMPLIRLTVAGRDTEEWRGVLDALPSLGFDGELGALEDVEMIKHRGVGILDIIAESSYRTSLDPTITTARLALEPTPFEDVLPAFKDAITRAFEREKDKQTHPDDRVFVRMAQEPSRQFSLAGFEYTPVTRRAIDPLTGRATLNHVPLHAPRLEFLRDKRTRAIPGFSGQIYEPDDRAYSNRAHQYATSSYDPEHTSPFLICYPKTPEDIALVLASARASGKKVVARSGGHHYSAKSSGGFDTIVISMDHFDTIKTSGRFVEVGPGARLTNIARSLRDANMTIPHGECPYVAIGGHAQTGGFGHLLRGFGLALDWVEAFDIVLADGSYKRVQRPPTDRPPQTPDEELFWGVLSGNAGSFGIVTRYRFECILDSAYPESYGYNAKLKYSKARFEAVMGVVQEWTAMLETDKAQNIDGLDLMVTVESAGRVPFPVMLVELVDRDQQATLDNPRRADAVNELEDTVESFLRRWERLIRDRGKESLSDLSDSFVRRWPATTREGREFPQPYKKRVNSTSRALTDGFIEGLVTKVDEVIELGDDVRLVYQMEIGGGELKHSPRRQHTGLPRRDYLYCFVFDLFYKESNRRNERNETPRDTAIRLQEEMGELLDNYFHHGQEERAFWGSFGDTDMSQQAVQRMYYDDLDVFARLQRLKQRVDPEDLFHTDFTVPLPPQ